MAPTTRAATTAALLAVTLAAACATPRSTHRPAVAASRTALGRIDHLVVIYLENRSFDNLYGEFPGADNLSSAAARANRQVDLQGAPYATLPQEPGSPFPPDLPNAPFDIERFVPPDRPTADLTHRFYHEQAQIDGGKMDRYAAVSSAKGLVMGHYRTMNLPLAQLARQYTLCDHFFHAGFGGSFFNHQWLIAARSPTFPNAPASMRAQVDGSGRVVKDGTVTPDGYVVNTAFSVNRPRPPGIPDSMLVPNQTAPTIGDRLSARGISWVWYSGGWDDAMAGHPDSLFQFHHQPFIYFEKYADGTPAKAEHLKDEKLFFENAAAGTLPTVSFIKPLGAANEHPGYTDVLTGERHVMRLVDAVRNGPNWQDAAIIITYDEHGGFWDHVPPPVIDRWGPGTRIPAIVVSPFAKKGHVDHTIYDTTSILALIEHRWGLEPLTDRDARAADMTAAFEPPATSAPAGAGGAER